MSLLVGESSRRVSVTLQRYASVRNYRTGGIAHGAVYTLCARTNGGCEDHDSGEQPRSHTKGMLFSESQVAEVRRAMDGGSDIRTMPPPRGQPRPCIFMRWGRPIIG